MICKICWKDFPNTIKHKHIPGIGTVCMGCVRKREGETCETEKDKEEKKKIQKFFWI